MKLYVYPYKTASESAKLLRDDLGAKMIKLSNSEYEHKDGNLVINWGSTTCPWPCLNPSDKVVDTVDKLRFFRLMNRQGQSLLIPRYWVNQWDIPDNAFPVFCRVTTTGCDGEGIVIAETRAELVPANLYTQAIPGCTEYRVTIFKGYGVTDIQTKLPRQGETQHPMIKTYSNGWGFQRKNIPMLIEEILTNVANKVLEVTGLDFCGIDILFDANEGEVNVLEVNTAMGLEGDALERFSQAVEWYVQRVEEEMAVVQPEIDQGPVDPVLEAYSAGNYAEVIQLVARML